MITTSMTSYFIKKIYSHDIHDWWQIDMFKISFENVTSNMIKERFATKVDKMVCHYIENMIINLFYTDKKLIISNLKN
jgi:hypothetical protein